MPTIIKITGLDQALAEVRVAVNAGMSDAVDLIGARGAKLVQDNIISEYQGRPAAVATGNLANAIFSEQTHAEGYMTATIDAAAPADVYAAPVEFGTRPHMPPISAILPWIKLKFGGASEKEMVSMAWAVAKSIAKRGTRGFHMFQRAEAQLQTEAQGIAESAIARAIRSAGLAPGAGGH